MGMMEVVDWATDVLSWGISSSEGSKPSRGDQILFVTVLFQNLTDARNAALPHELTSLIDTPPPSPWTFIAETAEAVFDEVDAREKEKAQKKAEWYAQQQATQMQEAMMMQQMMNQMMMQ